MKKRRRNPWLRPKVIFRLSLLVLIIVSLLSLLLITFTPHKISKEAINHIINKDFAQGLISEQLTYKEVPSRFTAKERSYIKSFELPDNIQNQLMSSPNFDINKMPQYHEILTSDRDYSVTYAIQLALHPNVKSNFYSDIVTVTKPDSLHVLVNKNFRLPENYIPSDLVKVDVPLYNPSSSNEANYLREEAAVALKDMFVAAKAQHGYKLIARSGYRSYKTQVSLYRNYVQTRGQLYADAFSARAGHSEHQTGLTMDITSESVSSGLSATFGVSKEGSWVAKHAHEFGFIIRYPEGRIKEVGYEYEPWHLRYVGVEAATEIYQNDLILEDYILEHELVDTL